MEQFQRSLAVVIGIQEYGNSIPALKTPGRDATRLADMLADEHGYETLVLTEQVTLARLRGLLESDLPARLGQHDRLLFYFAGHGVALTDEDGPAGYLIPQDAHADERESFLSMSDVQQALDALPCRHVLIILDCCFAGAFRWAAATRRLRMVPDVVHKERYDRYIRDPAWQVLTSAAYDQEALDVLNGDVLGVRETDSAAHSPFALALFEALNGAGDLVPTEGGDGVITASELYLYLRESVESRTEESRQVQTPGLWPLPKHDKGEYIFLVPGYGDLELPAAEELRLDNNPYKGLNPYDFTRDDARLFFGREALELKLAQQVSSRTLTVVLGASGTGKSSLVKAGLLPRLAGWGDGKTEADPTRMWPHNWRIVPPVRPTATPLRALSAALHEALVDVRLDTQVSASTSASGIAAQLQGWLTDHPDETLLLVIDQFEELVTLCRRPERETFISLLAELTTAHPERLRLVLTLRSDFEPQFADSALSGDWETAKFVVPPMDQDDLRRAIEGPAEERVLYFEPPELVDRLINEVIQTPGGLPLLSFTLSELYVKYVESDSQNRALNADHYAELGGVIGALRVRAEEEYAALPDDAHRETMRRVMLRMVAVEGGEMARRRAPRNELVYGSEAENRRVEAVLTRLVAARLLVVGQDQEGEDYVEPAHDALVRAWDRLFLWKQAAEVYLPLQRRVAQAATDWKSVSGDEQRKLLWNGNAYLPQLRQELTLGSGEQQADNDEGLFSRGRALLWPSLGQAHSGTWLNHLETEFVRQSVQRQVSLNRRITAITIAVIIALSVATGWATIQQGIAQEQTDKAVASQQTAIAQDNARATEVVMRSIAEEIAVTREAEAVAAEAVAVTQEAEAIAAQGTAEAEAYNARRSLSGQLALRSDADRAVNPQRSLLMAVEALRVTQDRDEPPVAEAEMALRASLVDVQGQPLTDFESNVCALAVSPDRRRLAMTDCNDGRTAAIWDLSAEEAQPFSLFGPNGEAFPMRKEASIAAQTAPREEEYPMEQVHGLFSHGGRWFVMLDPSVLTEIGVDFSYFLWDVDTQTGPVMLSLPGNFDTAALWQADMIPAFNQDETILAIGGYDGQIALWDLGQPQSPASLLQVEGLETPVLTMGFSPDASWLALTADDSPRVRGNTLARSVYVIPFDMSAKSAVAQPLGQGSPQPGGALAPSPPLFRFDASGKHLFTGTDAGTVERWDLTTAPATSTLVWHPDEQITLLEMDDQGRWLFAADLGQESPSIGLWQVDGPEPIPLVLPDPQGSVSAAVLYGATGTLAYSDGSDTYIVELANDATAENLQPPIYPILHSAGVLHFVRDGSRLVGSVSGSLIAVWDRGENERFERSHLLLGQEDFSPILALDSSGERIAAVSDAPFSTARLWEMERLNRQDARFHLADAQAVAVSDDERLLLAIEGDQLLAWDLLDGQIPPLRHLLLDGLGDLGIIEPLSVAINRAHNRLAIGNRAGGIFLWRWERQTLSVIGDAQQVQTAFPVQHLRFDPGDHWLFAASMEEWDGSVAAWALDNLSGRPIIFISEAGRVLDLVVSPDGRWLGAYRAAEQLDLWQLPDGATLAQADAVAPILLSAEDFAFSPDGKLLAVGGDRSIRLYELDALAQIDVSNASATQYPPPASVLVDGKAGPAGVAFSADGSILYAIPDGTELARWSIEGSRAVRQKDIPGENAQLHWLYVSSVSEWVAAVDRTSEFRLWNRSTLDDQSPARQLSSCCGRPLVISPDGNQLVALQQQTTYKSYRGPLYLWRLDIEGMLALACQRVGRNFSDSEWRAVFGDTPFRKTCVK